MSKNDSTKKAGDAGRSVSRTLLILLSAGEYTDPKGKTSRNLFCVTLRPRPLSEYDMTGDSPPKGRGFACKMERVRLVLGGGDMIPSWALDRNQYPAFVAYPSSAVATVRGGELAYEVRAGDLEHYNMSPPEKFHPPVVGDHPDL